ncbi:hypothetical protein AA0112_g12755, partial [Alternaria arborescens]
MGQDSRQDNHSVAHNMTPFSTAVLFCKPVEIASQHFRWGLNAVKSRKPQLFMNHHPWPLTGPGLVLPSSAEVLAYTAFPAGVCILNPPFPLIPVKLAGSNIVAGFYAQALFNGCTPFAIVVLSLASSWASCFKTLEEAQDTPSTGAQAGIDKFLDSGLVKCTPRMVY